MWYIHGLVNGPLVSWTPSRRTNIDTHNRVFLIIIINVKDWTLWSVPSSELQLLMPTLLWSSIILILNYNIYEITNKTLTLICLFKYTIEITIIVHSSIQYVKIYYYYYYYIYCLYCTCYTSQQINTSNNSQHHYQ